MQTWEKRKTKTSNNHVFKLKLISSIKISNYLPRASVNIALARSINPCAWGCLGLPWTMCIPPILKVNLAVHEKDSEY